ncbi:fumarylacetoacetate hydrolase family protein [Rathayibacter toxicus]|uniref:fumarylacetoacetate hydrolase family protein n=1 Tax=Rathayibacter toxicus TaxID=145458 RepID=UPI000CE8D4B2|nr:fumarylacetoacetate hydrolase family protein [Rathayibacter toxicus]PPI55681.1 2-hydroxyhepta-2,4-diene-1,7-dioate isomerase [Rathayibacter toxicus]QOD09826.1 fumarylacetoacetate hydrolase family protein [Rathayibacter toxicus]QWL28489.1 FAA hydrolase family protein [Rathayibacter toxicus]
MKVARFATQRERDNGGAINFGILDEDDLVVLVGDPMFVGFDTTGERIPLAEAKLLAPVIPRSKVVAIGKNYADHVAEMGGEIPSEPLIFLKPNTAVIGPGDAIVLPEDSQRVECEGELAIVIGAVARHVRAEDYQDVVFGYTIANDVTARDLQRADGQWARAKGYDTFCPVGPVIETELVWNESALETRVNGRAEQSASTGDMIHGVPEIIASVSRVFTLLPGDLILTGTPAGTAPIANGDTVAIDIDGIGTLFNSVTVRA